MVGVSGQELGAQVRKGERACVVVYAGAIECNEVNNDVEEVETHIPSQKPHPARKILSA